MCVWVVGMTGDRHQSQLALARALHNIMSFAGAQRGVVWRMCVLRQYSLIRSGAQHPIPGSPAPGSHVMAKRNECSMMIILESFLFLFVVGKPGGNVAPDHQWRWWQFAADILDIARLRLSWWRTKWSDGCLLSGIA